MTLNSISIRNNDIWRGDKAKDVEFQIPEAGRLWKLLPVAHCVHVSKQWAFPSQFGWKRRAGVKRPAPSWFSVELWDRREKTEVPCLWSSFSINITASKRIDADTFCFLHLHWDPLVKGLSYHHRMQFIYFSLQVSTQILMLMWVSWPGVE